MKKDKKKKLRGRPSFVLKGLTNGGTLVIRLDEDLHRQFAKVCKSHGKSMNKTVTMMIDQYCNRATSR